MGVSLTNEDCELIGQAAGEGFVKIYEYLSNNRYIQWCWQYAKDISNSLWILAQSDEIREDMSKL